MLLFSLFLFSLYGAPAPGTLLSRSLSPYSEAFWRLKGFSLQIPENDWKISNAQGQAPIWRFERSSQEFIALRVWPEQKKNPAPSAKEFSAYGLQVLRNEKLPNLGGLQILDLESRSQQRQRQYIWTHASLGSVQLSCGGPTPQFAKLVKECNEIAARFTWISTEGKLPSLNQKVSETAL